MTKEKSVICRETFTSLVEPLLGLPISRPHEGYGKAIVIHLGQLSDSGYRRRDGTMVQEGEASFMLEGAWRVERDKSVWFSSTSCITKRQLGLDSLLNKSIQAIHLMGRLPELSVHLSNNLWIQSFGFSGEESEWAVFLTTGGWVCSEFGEVVFVNANDLNSSAI